MTPERRIELLEVVYWSCPVPTHRHKTRDTAQACCAKEARAAPQRPKNRWTHETLAGIGERRAAGKSVAEIAAEYGVSEDHMRIIIARWERHVRLNAAADELRERMRKGDKHGV